MQGSTRGGCLRPRCLPLLTTSLDGARRALKCGHAPILRRSPHDCDIGCDHRSQHRYALHHTPWRVFNIRLGACRSRCPSPPWVQMGPGSVWTQTPTAAPANPHYVRRQLQRSQPQASSQALRSLVHARNQPQEAAGQPHTQSAERLPRARRRQQCQLSSVVCSSHSNSNGSAVPPPSSRRDYWAVLSVILVGCLVFRFGSARAPGVVLAALQATAGPVARKGAHLARSARCSVVHRVRRY